MRSTGHGGAVRLWPGHAEAERRGAALRARLESLARAHELALRAEEILTGLDDIRRRAGLAAQEAALARAEAMVRKMESTAADAPETLCLRGRLLSLQGRDGDAIASFRRALARDPRCLPALLSLGLALADSWRDQGEAVAVREEATQVFNEVLRLAATDSLEHRCARAVLSELSGRNDAEAVRLYAELVGEPGWMGDRALQRRAYLRLESHAEEAVTDLELLRTLRPWWDDVTILLAQAYLALGRTADLEALLAAAKRESPDSLVTRAVEARLTEARGELAAAEAIYSEMIDRAAGDSAPLGGRALLRIRRGDFAGAIRDLDALPALRWDRYAVFHRAVAMAGLGKLEEAEAELSRAIGHHPGCAEYWFLRGTVRRDRGVAGAEDDLREAIRLDPLHEKARLSLGRLLLDAGRLEEAEGAFREAGDACPQSQAQALAGRAEACALAGGRDAQAMELADEAVRLAPGDAGVRILRGNLRSEAGNLEGAREDYLAATVADPSSPDAWFNLGAVYQTQHDPDRALDAYRRAAASQPSDPDARVRAAQILATRKDWAGAKEMAESGLARFPEATELLFLRGVARLGLGAAAEAEVDLTGVLGRVPGHAGALFHRGEARLARGDTPGAIEDYERFLGAFPEDRLAPLARRRIEGVKAPTGTRPR